LAVANECLDRLDQFKWQHKNLQRLMVNGGLAERLVEIAVPSIGKPKVAVIWQWIGFVVQNENVPKALIGALERGCVGLALVEIQVFFRRLGVQASQFVVWLRSIGDRSNDSPLFPACFSFHRLRLDCW
jgi:hypothetical protein